MKNTEGICKYCGAPVKMDAEKCPYCRVRYIRPIRTIDATSPFFDVKLKDETIRMYISDIQECAIIDSGRDVHGYIKGAVVKNRCRKITLVEV